MLSTRNSFSLLSKCLPLVPSDIHLCYTYQPLTFVILADVVYVYKIIPCMYAYIGYPQGVVFLIKLE